MHKHWWSRQDDELPDWAHTAAVMVIALAFAAPWLWSGLQALVSGTLEPTMGPEFGAWLFGPTALTGRAARVGGSSLVVLGLVFAAWGLACTRWAEHRRLVRLLPWGLMALDLMLCRWVIASR